MILEQSQHEHAYRELLANGSLKLTFSSAKVSPSPSRPPVDLLTTFRCAAHDSFGHIVSRPSRIYRLNAVDSSVTYG